MKFPICDLARLAAVEIVAAATRTAVSGRVVAHGAVR